MKTDYVERIGSSLIHHGKENNRIYLMHLSCDDMPDLPDYLDALARKEGYTKIVCKVNALYKEPFLCGGYQEEAKIPGYFSGRDDAVFLSRFLDPKRAKPVDKAKIDKVLATAKKRSLEDCLDKRLLKGYACRQAQVADVDDMTTLYKEVFATYPFPIHDADYIKKTMADNLIYFGVWKDDKLIGLSSIETDRKNKNAEMTDFATLPQHRGEGLATYLLQTMDHEMMRRGLCTAYTIARAVSFGINLTFASCDYQYGGTLVQNTQISGSLESMNIWHKDF